MLKRMTATSVLAGAVAFGLSAAAPLATAQAAPKFSCSTARLIVPWGPGGGTAVLFGIFEKHMNSKGAKPGIKVVTIPGQAGNKGAKEALKAKPDGCTLFAIHQSAIISYLNGRVKFNYDAFDTVAHLTVTPSILGGSPKAPFNTYEEMIAAAKKSPGNILTGASIGATSHFLWLIVGERTGTSYKYVPFAGGTGKRVKALLNDTIQLAEINAAAAGKLISTGVLKAYAIAAEKRSPQFPKVPTLREKGVDLLYALNRGIVVPKGTPKDKIAHWAAAFKAAVENPTLQKSIAAKGTGLKYIGPDAYAGWFKAQTALFRKVHDGIKKTK